MGQQDCEPVRSDHPQLAVLAKRIAKLEKSMSRALGCGQIAELDGIKQLMAQYTALDERWRRLDQQGACATPEREAEIAAMIDDLAGTVEDVMIWIYRSFQAGPAARDAHTPPGTAFPIAARRGDLL
jgi:hypothetical protein